MKLWGVSSEALVRVVKEVSKKKYKGNLVLRGPEQQGKTAILHDTIEDCETSVEELTAAITFTLRVIDSRGIGAHIAASGRRSTSLCWHGHRDVMWELFHRFPEARLKSRDDDYHGVAEFLLTYEETGEEAIALNIYNKIGCRKEQCKCNDLSHEIKQEDNGPIKIKWRETGGKYE